jgi:hypothetical protein
MIEEEKEGANKYNEIGDKFHEMAADEAEHAKELETIEAEKMGVEAAGPTPNSLLAEQDLEGETTEKGYSNPNSNTIEDVKSRIKGLQANLSNFKVALARAEKSPDDRDDIRDIENDIDETEDKIQELKQELVQLMQINKSTDLIDKMLAPDEKKRLTELRQALQTAKRNADDAEYIRELEAEIEKLVGKDTAKSITISSVTAIAKKLALNATSLQELNESVFYELQVKGWNPSYIEVRNVNEICKNVWYDIKKSGDAITSTQNDLEEAKEKSEDTETTEEEGLVQKLREIQEKRMSATIKQREPEAIGKNFKTSWKTL